MTEPTPEDLETMARALRSFQRHPQASTYDELPERFRHHYRDFAAAVFTALPALGFERRKDTLEECAKLADLYAETNCEQMGDSILLDPLLHGGQWTKENVERSDDLIIDGTIHSAMFHAAQNIAEAIRALPTHRSEKEET